MPVEFKYINLLRKQFQRNMQIIHQKYIFDQKSPLIGTYQDAQIRNYSYKAVSRSDGKQVQLVIYRSIRAGQITAYFQKASKYAEVKHPHLTPILECGHNPEANLLFVVLEWTRGYSLKQLLANQVLNWKTAYRIIRDVLSGLSQLHRKGLLYSFINLENIEICEGKGRLSLRYLITKSYYLSPEVKESQQMSKQCELFSMGVCLFHMIFGKFPFKAKSSAEQKELVKSGVARELPAAHTIFPNVIPVEMQQYINTLTHIQPAQRIRHMEQQKRLDEMVGWRGLSFPKSVLGQNYILLNVETSSEEYVRASVIDLNSQRLNQRQRVFHLEMIKHSPSEIATYIDDIIKPFIKAPAYFFVNIHQYYATQEHYLVIIYDYCPQGSLKDYNAIKNFSKQMIEETSALLRNILCQWRGQYRFLTNEQVLINQGRPVLKLPPFPTKSLWAKLKLAKTGEYFIAPEIEGGIQSLTADSWSVGAIEYWMRFKAMPEFDDQDQLIINEWSKLTVEQYTELVDLLHKKHQERKNLFPPEKKPVDHDSSYGSQSSADNSSFSSHSSFSSSSIVSSLASPDSSAKSSRALKSKMEPNEQIIQQQPVAPGYDFCEQDTGKVRKKAQTAPSFIFRLSLTEQDINLKHLKKNISPKQPHILSENQLEKVFNKEGKGLQTADIRHYSKDSRQHGNFTSHINLLQKVEESTYPKVTIKRLPASPGGNMQRKANKRSQIQLARNREATRHQRGRQRQQPGNLRGMTSQSDAGNKPMSICEELLSGLAKEAWRGSSLNQHWSKPIRICSKVLIALIICIFTFYIGFFNNNAQLMSSRYDFDIQILYLRTNQTTSNPTILFPAVTRNPLLAYNSLNNQTLAYIRGVEKCVIIDFNNSNVHQTITSSFFVIYQAFGFMIAILNLIIICLSIIKFDLPKALSLIQIDELSYAPLFNWMLVNMAIASLTSCTYLAYGGLFDLRLDPCLSRSSFPSLTYLLENQLSSFIWRFISVYMGILIAYGLIGYLLIRPKALLPYYGYVWLIILYIAGVGARAMGTYELSLCSIFGASGELLILFTGIPIFLIDFLADCMLIKVTRNHVSPTAKVRANQMETTQENFNVE